MRDQFSLSDDDRQRFMETTYRNIATCGRHYFWRRRYRGETLQDKVQEAQGLAWHRWVSSPAARRYPCALARFTCWQVASGRTLLCAGNKGRSIDDPRRMCARGVCRVSFDDYVSYKDSPPDIAEFHIDIPAWMLTLPPSLRKTARLLIRNSGGRERDVADLLGISPGRLSQRKRELFDRWNRFSA